MDTTGVRVEGSSFRHRVEQSRIGSTKEARLMSIGETAGYLGVTEAALHMMIKRGKVGGVMKLSERRTCFNKRALDRWIETKTE